MPEVRRTAAHILVALADIYTHFLHRKAMRGLSLGVVDPFVPPTPLLLLSQGFCRAGALRWQADELSLEPDSIWLQAEELLVRRVCSSFGCNHCWVEWGWVERESVPWCLCPDDQLKAFPLPGRSIRGEVGAEAASPNPP